LSRARPAPEESDDHWTAFPAVRLDLANFNVSVVFASVVIATAIFPPFVPATMSSSGTVHAAHAQW
jgi:hypothetical protein